MNKKVLLIILFMLIIISAAIETAFVINKRTNNIKNTNIYNYGDNKLVKPYMVYFLYDANVSQETLVYDILELNQTMGVTEKAASIINKLTGGKDGISPIPKGTKLLNIYNDGDVITLDFSKEFQSNHTGGTLGEKITIDTIVNSITEIEGINKVLFKIDGQVKDVYLHLVFNKAFESNIDKYTVINDNQKEQAMLASLLFVDTKSKIYYEGGPVHWGSRTAIVDSIDSTGVDKKVILKITDQSDLRGEEPTKKWTETWELTKDGLYVDGFLAIKLPLVVGKEWIIENYKPIMLDKTKTYKARVKISKIEQVKNDNGEVVTQISTELYIDDVKTVDNKQYYERQVYETGIGYRNRHTTEPTIENFDMGYWFYQKVEK